MSRKIYDGTYNFNPAGGTIQFNSGITSHKQILVITNLTQKVMIYNFADPSLSGSFDTQSKQLTVDFNTSVHYAGDVLQIFYEPAEDAMLQLIDTLYELVARLDFLPSIRGGSADIRVTPVGGSTAITSLPATPAGTNVIGSISNQVTIGGHNAGLLISATVNESANQNIGRVTF